MKSIAFLAFLAVGAASQAQFYLMAAESAPGSNPPGSWRGVQRYSFTGNGAVAVAESGIAAGQVNDPYGLALSTSGEFFVGNRHGNSGQSSVSRFVLDGSNNFLANGTITDASMSATHGVALRPGSGDLYAISAFTNMSVFSAPGFGFAGSIAVANQRDLVFNGSGSEFYSSQASGTLRQYNIAGGTSSFFNVTGASSIHQLAWRGNDLYAADFGSGQVFRITVDGSGSLVSSVSVASVAGAIGIAFSPDGNEMFVSGHTTGLISRFAYDVNSQNWTQTGSIDMDSFGGNLLVYADPIPEPATMLVLAAGIGALCRRRRCR